MSLIYKTLLALCFCGGIWGLVGLFILGYEDSCHRCRHGRNPSWDRDRTVESLAVEIADCQRKVALHEMDEIPFANSICGWYDHDCYARVLCLKNTNEKDWKPLREDAVLAIAQRAVPYTFETRNISSVIYIVSASDIWRVEVDSALEEKIWAVVNRHNGALDKCSASEFWNLLSKEATREGQVTKETWHYMCGPY